MTPLDLFPYQKTGAHWLATRERAGLLDEPGAGKSAQVVRAADLRRAHRGVVICPATLRENWRHEFAKFGHLPRRVVKGMTLHDLVAWQREVFDVLTLSYDMARRWAPHFHAHGGIFDFLVLDEAQDLRNLDTQRTRTIIGKNGCGGGGIAQWALQAWMLSGTIMPNDPVDIYPLLRFCRASELSREAFVRRYLDVEPRTWSERTTPRTEHLEELRALVRRCSIRRTLQDVGVELPPIHLTTTLVDGDAEPVRALIAAHPGLDRAIVEAVRKGGLSFLDSQHISTLRRLIADAKAVPYAEMLAGELLTIPDRKVVVGGISRDALRLIHQYLRSRGLRTVLVQGSTPERERQHAIEEFDRDPGIRGFITNLDVGGVGLNLTAANWADVFESSWTPGKNAQFLKRIRRIGQVREQHARFVALACSLDETVLDIVVEKTQAIALVAGDAMVAAPA